MLRLRQMASQSDAPVQPGGQGQMLQARRSPTTAPSGTPPRALNITAMWHALVWVPVLMVVAGWTALCALAHALLRGLASGGAQPGAWLAWLEQWQIPLALAQWLPLDGLTALKTLITALIAWAEPWLAGMPELLGWLVPLLWLGWSVVALMLLALGVVGSVLVSALRRSPPATASVP